MQGLDERRGGVTGAPTGAPNGAGGPTPDDEAPDFRRLAIRIFFFNMLVLAAAFTLYWYWVANAVEADILYWIGRQRAAGQTLEFSDYRRGGYPLTVALTFRDVRYAPGGDDAGWSYRVDGVTLSHPLTNPSSLGITLNGSQEVVIGGGGSRSVYGGGFEAAGGTLRAGGWLPNGEFAAREMALVDLASRRGVAVGALALTAAGNAAAPPSPQEPGYRLSMSAARLALPGIDVLPFGPEIAELKVEAEVMGALTPMPLPDLLAAWSEAGGAVELTRLFAAHGPVSAEGTGTLTIAGNGQPEAAFSFHVEGFPLLLDRLVAMGLLDGGTAAGIKGLVMPRAKTDADGKTRVRVPLTLQDGVLTLGPVPLATVPVIRWSGTRVPAVDGS
ncbi:MAG: DUF2125 domain-containing protein [Rhodospirillales bacterium]|jgi:hypothetical protein|nr:DUF2125 domain-containing protein [Rhodospirillales bacterium]